MAKTRNEDRLYDIHNKIDLGVELSAAEKEWLALVVEPNPTLRQQFIDLAVYGLLDGEISGVSSEFKELAYDQAEGEECLKAQSRTASDVQVWGLSPEHSQQLGCLSHQGGRTAVTALQRAQRPSATGWRETTSIPLEIDCDLRQGPRFLVHGLPEGYRLHSMRLTYGGEERQDPLKCPLVKRKENRNRDDAPTYAFAAGHNDKSPKPDPQVTVKKAKGDIQVEIDHDNQAFVSCSMKTESMVSSEREAVLNAECSWPANGDGAKFYKLIRLRRKGRNSRQCNAEAVMLPSSQGRGPGELQLRRFDESDLFRLGRNARDRFLASTRSLTIAAEKIPGRHAFSCRVRYDFQRDAINSRNLCWSFEVVRKDAEVDHEQYRT